MERGTLTASPQSYGTVNVGLSPVRALRSWVERTGEAWPGDGDVFVYFNNDQHAAALYDAAAFASLVHRAGRQVTAAPTPDPGQAG